MVKSASNNGSKPGIRYIPTYQIAPVSSGETPAYYLLDVEVLPSMRSSYLEGTGCKKVRKTIRPWNRLWLWIAGLLGVERAVRSRETDGHGDSVSGPLQKVSPGDSPRLVPRSGSIVEKPGSVEIPNPRTSTAAGSER